MAASTTQLIVKLHQAAYRRFPRAEVHAILHESAELAFGVGSLTQCTSEQLNALMTHIVRGYPVRRTRSSRPRSGRPAQEGVVRMATQKQRWLINALASELAWSQGILDRWLKRYFGCDSVDKLATSADASKAINWLKSIKFDKAEKRMKVAN